MPVAPMPTATDTWAPSARVPALIPGDVAPALDLDAELADRSPGRGAALAEEEINAVEPDFVPVVVGR
jgi:hypothetical protein